MGTAREIDAVDYQTLERQVVSLLEDENDFIANTANFAAFVFHEIPAVNWAGFYFPEAAGLVLGPFGGRPACTRLPRGRGVCSAAFGSGRTVIVDDVLAYADHIACDSSSRSEIVVPLMLDRTVVGVFDVDSPIASRFTQRDARGLERLIERLLERTPFPERYKASRDVSRGEATRIKERIDIHTCRNHHVVLRYLVDEIAKAANDPASIAPYLARLRSILLAHLNIEDNWLYPQLARSPNPAVRSKAERYTREMGGLRDGFAALWVRWGDPGAIEGAPEAWQRDWQPFERAMSARMDAEDNDLYAAAEAATAETA